MPKFLLTILIIVGVFYGVKYLFRFLFPFIINRWMSKMMEDKQNPFFQEKVNEKKEGDVTISQKSKSKRKDNNTEGEYVDFEEVD